MALAVPLALREHWYGGLEWRGEQSRGNGDSEIWGLIWRVWVCGVRIGFIPIPSSDFSCGSLACLLDAGDSS